MAIIINNYNNYLARVGATLTDEENVLPLTSTSAYAKTDFIISKFRVLIKNR